MFTRLVMIPWTQDFSSKEFLLDITCIKTKYVLGWYLSYLLFWYIAFFILKIIPRIQKYEMIIWLIISLCVFFGADSALQAQQALSFVTGVFLSKIGKEKRQIICQHVVFIILVSFGIGCIAFVSKQLIRIEEVSYCMWLIKLLYRYGWAITVVMLSWVICKIFKMRMFSCLGVLSYEIYLVHGYCLEIMSDKSMIIPCLGITVMSSLLIHYLFHINKMKGEKICLKEKHF